MVEHAANHCARQGLLHGLARPPAPERGIRRVLDHTTEWLAPRWGDVYLHETVIAHIRRLLDTDYRCASLNETVPRFQDRMSRVAAHLNSPNFRAHGGRGMCGLAKDLRRRCADVVRLKGERLPK